MDVDCSANYGIGYKVEASDELIDCEKFENEYCGELLEYIDSEINEAFKSFEVGDSAYNDIYICLRKPFKNGLDLTKRKQELDKEANRLKLKVVSEFNEAGGLMFW